MNRPQSAPNLNNVAHKFALFFSRKYLGLKEKVKYTILYMSFIKQC